MKYFLIFFLFGFGICFGQSYSNVSLDQLKWILGQWERTDDKEGQQSFEKWAQEEDKKFRGIGFTMAGKDTVFVERLSLITKEDEVYYVADVANNPEPVRFKLTHIADTIAIFENPIHDYPKMITYKLVAPDELKSKD